MPVSAGLGLPLPFLEVGLALAVGYLMGIPMLGLIAVSTLGGVGADGGGGGGPSGILGKKKI